MTNPDYPTSPLKIFFCYSHIHEELRDEIERHLPLTEVGGTPGGWCQAPLIPCEATTYALRPLRPTKNRGCQRRCERSSTPFERSNAPGRA